MQYILGVYPILYEVVQGCLFKKKKGCLLQHIFNNNPKHPKCPLTCIYYITQQLHSWKFIRENLGQHKNFIQMFITALFII